MNSLENIINHTFDNRADIDLPNAGAEIRNAVLSAIELLDSGEARVAEKVNGDWQVNQWLKKAVLLYFGIEKNKRIDGGHTTYFDKVPLKFAAVKNIILLVLIKHLRKFFDHGNKQAKNTNHPDGDGLNPGLNLQFLGNQLNPLPVG